jgi:hypothetical protein
MQYNRYFEEILQEAFSVKVEFFGLIVASI